LGKNIGWATFWATFSQKYLVTLLSFVVRKKVHLVLVTVVVNGLWIEFEELHKKNGLIF
jgi:hypothetical protein